MYKFIGKSVLIETGGKRILALSDLHLGYNERLYRSGIFVPNRLFQDMLHELNLIFTSMGTVDDIVILGDLKHVFGLILQGERTEILHVLDFMKQFCKKIIIIKGNHDTIIEPIAADRNVQVVDYYIQGSYAFLHGDRDFPTIYEKSVDTWVVGHAHPAVILYDSAKSEKYKCFLVGTYKRKIVIVVPSFFSATEGTDVCTQPLGLAWDLNVHNCTVYIVGDDLAVLDFGLVKKLVNS